MIVLLSPAKSLDYSKSKFEAIESPKFRKESKILIDLLRKYKPDGIQKLMKVSEKIANLNVERYQNYSIRYTDNNSKAALLAFDGDVYKGVDANSFTKTQINFAQKHVRILSGLYGILRPLDKMQAYRLEMGTDLKNLNGKNLYAFWGDKITKSINKELKDHKSNFIINLASNEYFKVINKSKLKAPIINVNFKEYKGDELKFISFNAKKARGLMTQYIVKNKITDPKQLIGFDYESYSYNEELSSSDNLMFVR